MWERRGFKVGDVVPGPDGQLVRILRVIAEGGFSVVYEGRLEPSGAPCAIKALRLKHAGNRKTAERLLREGRALYALRHPNVVPVLYIGMRTEDELIYLVMKLLKGRNLRELQQDLTASQRDSGGDKRPRSHARLPVSWVLEIAIAMCSALDAIHHKASAIHRDLKPENTFVEDDGNVSLFDVGSAKFPKETRLTTNDMTIGTVQYMSPEQLFRPADVNHRSDLFALGTILYELLSGVLPFAAAPGELDDTQAQGNRIIFQPHRPLKESAPHVPEYVIDIVERLLKKKVEERYPSAARVRDLLAAAHERFVSGLGELAPLPLAEAVAAVPRTISEATAELAPLPALPTSTNPFVTISLPPELPQDAAPVTTEELPASAMSLAAAPDRAGTARPVPETPAAAEPERRPAYVFVAPPASASPGASTQHAQEAPQADAAPTSQDGESKQRLAALRRHIAELPEELRRPFVLNQIHQMPIEEIAEAMGVSAATVRERVLEARSRLGARIEEDAEAAPPVEASQAGSAPAADPRHEAESLNSHVREVQPSAASERSPAAAARAPRALRFAVAFGLASVVALTSYALLRQRHVASPERELDAGLQAATSASSSTEAPAPPTPQEVAAASVEPPPSPVATPAVTSVASASPPHPGATAQPLPPKAPQQPVAAVKPRATPRRTPATPAYVPPSTSPAPPPTAKNRLFDAEK